MKRNGTAMSHNVVDPVQAETMTKPVQLVEVVEEVIENDDPGCPRKSQQRTP